MPVVLGLAYVLLVHLAVMRQDVRIEWAALLLLIAIPQYAALRAGRWRHWLLLIALAAAAWPLVRIGGGIYALYLPPVLLPALVLTVFAGSLRPGQRPVVARIAALMSPPLSPARERHCRQVTWLWVLVLAAQIAAALVLAVTGPRWLWSLVTNFVNYAVMGALFVGEYIVRRWRFPELPHQGLLAYLRALTRVHYPSA